jgi:hypothetical protein
MRQDAGGRWISNDGGWGFEAATDRWLPRTPPTLPPSESVDPPPPPPGVAPPPPQSDGAGAPVPVEAGSLLDLGLGDPVQAGDLPPVGPPGTPPAADRADPADETRPGLVVGARPTGRHAVRPGAAGDSLATLLTPRRLAVLATVLALVVVAVLVLARGRAGSRTARPPSPPVATSAAIPAGYPPSAQQAFLDACVGSTPERRPFCSCSLDQIEQQMPWAEFRQVGQQATNGDAAARARYTTMVAGCTSQLPRTGP